MRSFAMTVCLWIAVTAIAISVGANVFQMVVIDPVWSGSPPESVRSFFSGTPWAERLARFHSNPLGLVALLCLLVSPLLAWNTPELRKWLILAIAIQVVVAVGTVLYVWPINRTLADPAADPATIVTLTHRWLLADRTRFVLRLASFLCLLKAMTLPR